MRVRLSAVDGLFYPSSPDQLRGQVNELLSTVHPLLETPPKAVIVPHAGFIYSGSTAAYAYQEITKYADRYKKVVLIGPSHHVAFRGLAVPSAEKFDTPLGQIPIAEETQSLADRHDYTMVSDEPHRREHSLEVQLPFLQICLPSFELIPILAGDASPDEVAGLLGLVWGREETLIVVSSDLSHYLPYDEARARDQATSQKILHYQSNLEGEEACGCRAVNGLLSVARQKGLHIEQLALQNSGDTAGDHSRVVGYGAYALH